MKKDGNILDRMWHMFPDRDHMLWRSVGNWDNNWMISCMDSRKK